MVVTDSCNHSALVCMPFSLEIASSASMPKAHPCGLVPIISSSASFAISFLVMPRYFLRIYSLSCPRVGAGLRILVGVLDNFTGKPGYGWVPVTGRVTVSKKPLASI